MKALAKLKDDARKHEQKEEWEKAIEAYVAVLKTSEGAEAEAELPLYNRIGDLFVRLGRPIDAVTYYERAADHYAEAGFFNNAIALCNKALRYLPSRLELLRKLGQFSAAQGFITDARRWYLEYAERQLKQGALDDAFKALEDFAQVHEDAEIRELLGRHLYAHNRPGEALAALSRARELRVQAGEMEVANRLAQEILSLDPTAKLEVPSAAPRPEPVAEVSQAVQEPPAPPAAIVEPAPSARSSALYTDLPGLPEPPAPVRTELPGLPEPAVPETEQEDEYEYEAAEEDVAISDAPITSDTAVFAGSEPATVDALATFDGGSDDSTGGLESGLIDLDSIPDINMPFDLETTSLSLGGEVPVIEKQEFPPVELEFMTTGLEPLESQPEPAMFADAFTGFSEFSLEESLETPAVDAPSFIESEVGFEADVDFTAPPAQEAAQKTELETQPFGFDYEAPPVQEESSAPQEVQWIVEGLEQDPEPISFNEMLVEEESASASATIPSDAEAPTDDIEFIEPEPPSEIDYEFAEQEDTWAHEVEVAEHAAAAEPEAPRFSFENASYPGIEAEELTDVAASIEEPVEAAFGEAEVADELIEPDTIEAADEFFAHAVADAEEVDELAEALLDEPAPATPGAPAVESYESAAVEETLAEVALDGSVTQRESFRVEAEIETPAEEVTRHEPIPGWEPPAPPADIEPVLPTPEPAVLNGATELERIRRLMLAGDAFGAAHELEALHPKLAASGQMREAWEATNALLDLDPTNQRVLQQRVEYAAASGDLELGLQSYLEFGRFLQRTGAEGKARVIFQRVLDLDPHNAEASAFMKAAAPPKVTTGYVDLLALLGDEDEQAENTRFMVAEKPPTGDEERDFADMLAQFKQKVAENVSLSESGAHYDLGLAFKEMGLIDEAIAEFQVALKGGEERLKVYEELGQCFLAKQQYTVAVTVLNRALTLPVKDDSDLLGVYYSLGRSYEELGRPAEARSAYERVVGFDIGFRDAAERLARL